MAGGLFENVTFSFAEAVLPARSVACTVIALFPCERVSKQLNEPTETLAGTPLQDTAATPERASDTAPLRVTDDEETVAPFAGDEMLTTGGVRSRLTVVVVEFDSPATSVTVPVTDCACPSALKVCGAEHVEIAEALGTHRKLTVTALLFQPLAFGAGETTAVIEGGTVSIFNVTLAVAVFPAASVTVPLMT